MENIPLINLTILKVLLNRKKTTHVKHGINYK